MAETTTTTSTRGRKPKAVVEAENTNTTTSASTSNEDVIAMLMKQIEDLKNQINTQQTQKVEPTVPSTALPRKVKVISLVPNTYNLSTEDNGHGKVFTFEDFGAMKTIQTSELEAILSNQMYREQAENGYFYILDKAIVADQDLDDAYERIADKETMERVLSLADRDALNVFYNMPRDMQESIASRVAEKIIDGQFVDANFLDEIMAKTDINVRAMVEQFKSNKPRK